MANYYLDIETEGFNPNTDKVICIQIQELDGWCKPKGPLVKLKEWELGEERIVQLIHGKLFGGRSNWDFVPVGYNLIFDFNFLFSKFSKYKLDCPTLDKFVYDRPMIDIKHTLVIANDIDFKGSGLDKMTNKKTDGRVVPEFYKRKEYDKIDEYTTQETESFLECFAKLAKILKEAFPKNES